MEIREKVKLMEKIMEKWKYHKISIKLKSFGQRDHTGGRALLGMVFAIVV